MKNRKSWSLKGSPLQAIAHLLLVETLLILYLRSSLSRKYKMSSMTPEWQLTHLLLVLQGPIDPPEVVLDTPVTRYMKRFMRSMTSTD